MRAARPSGVVIGDQVQFAGGRWTVRQLAGAAVVLTDVTGAEIEVAISELMADPSFTVVSGNALRRAPVPARGVAGRVPGPRASMGIARH